jgi:hypothetical protein
VKFIGLILICGFIGISSNASSSDMLIPPSDLTGTSLGLEGQVDYGVNTLEEEGPLRHYEPVPVDHPFDSSTDGLSRAFYLTAIPKKFGGGMISTGSLRKTEFSRWIVRQSDETGRHWTTIDDFGGTDGDVQNRGEAWRAAVDEQGFIYVVGFLRIVRPEGTVRNWIVRKKHVWGNEWVEVDRFNLSNFPNVFPQDIIFVPNQGMIVIGGAFEGENNAWIIRRETEDGTWETVDFAVDQFGNNITITKDGTLYANGSTYFRSEENQQRAHVLIKKSTDGGKTWREATVRKFEGTRWGTSTMKASPTGEIYVSGTRILLEGGGAYWYTLKSNREGKNWRLVDRFELEEGKANDPFSIEFDRYGSVYVTGHSTDANDVQHLIVRRSDGFWGSYYWETFLDYTGPLGKGVFGVSSLVMDEQLFSAGFMILPNFTQDEWIVIRKGL